MSLCVNGGHVGAVPEEVGDFKDARGRRIKVRMNVCPACLSAQARSHKDEMFRLATQAIEGARLAHGLPPSQHARAILGTVRYDRLFPRAQRLTH